MVLRGGVWLTPYCALALPVRATGFARGGGSPPGGAERKMLTFKTSQHPYLGPKPHAARMEFGHGPHQRVEPIRRSTRGEPAQTEVTHLVLKRLQRRTDVPHPALLLHHGDRLGTQPLSPRCAYRAQRHAGIDLLNHRAHHVAAEIDLGYKTVGFEAVKQRHRFACPSMRIQA